jgi:3-methyladenine DNA glycosylase AlkD
METTRLDIWQTAEEIHSRLTGLARRDTQSVRDLRREYSRSLKNAPAKDILALALLLLKDPRYGHRFVAYELICHHRAALQSLGETELGQLGFQLGSWDAVDTFACYLSGPAWREGQVQDDLIQRWAYSPDRWWRRAALVSTVPLNNRARGGSGDTGRTLLICQMLVADRDDMVVKALSWALRELAKHDPAAVEVFLAEYGDVLAARVRREVRHKLDTGLKNPRKNRSGSDPIPNK